MNISSQLLSLEYPTRHLQNGGLFEQYNVRYNHPMPKNRQGVPQENRYLRAPANLKDDVLSIGSFIAGKIRYHTGSGIYILINSELKQYRQP